MIQAYRIMFVTFKLHISLIHTPLQIIIIPLYRLTTRPRLTDRHLTGCEMTSIEDLHILGVVGGH